MTLKELLEKHLGENEEAQAEILKTVGESMIPKSTYSTLKEKYETETKDLKTKYDDLENSTLTAQQLAEKESQKVMEELKGFKVKANRSTVENKFLEKGYSKETYETLLDTIVSDNEELSLSMADKFITTLESVKESTSKEVEKKFANGTPNPNGEGESNEDGNINTDIPLYI